MCNIHKYLYWKMKGLLHNILKLKKKMCINRWAVKAFIYKLTVSFIKFWVNLKILVESESIDSQLTFYLLPSFFVFF